MYSGKVLSICPHWLNVLGTLIYLFMWSVKSSAFVARSATIDLCVSRIQCIKLMKLGTKSKVIFRVMSLFVLKDYSGTPDAKRGLNFGGPGSSSDQKKLQGKASVVHAIPVASPGLSLIPIGVTNPSEALTQGFVPPRPQNQLLEKAFMDAMPVVMLTSTLLAHKVATHANSSNADSQEKETSVHLTVKCAIKPVHKELKDDYAAISKQLYMALLSDLQGRR